MCGIVGIWRLDGAAVGPASMRSSTGAIRHRGPDDEGYLLVNTRAGRTISCGGPDTEHRLSLPDVEQFNSEHFDLAFGFRRLSILDLSPAGYQQWGESCVDHFNGMFAFAVWHSVEKKIFIARDRLGEKPFNYVYVPGRLFAFASEIKALWAAGVAGRRIHEETLALFTEYGHVDIGEQTVYEDVLRLPQAHCLTVTADGRLRKRRYWDVDPRVQVEGWSDERCVEHFADLLINSVRMRLHADVPVGSSLSGGIDSSTIVGIINRLLPKTSIQKTFSARFDDPSRDEGRWMELVTKKNRVERHDVWPTAEEFFAELSDLFWHQEEPFTSTSVYAQWNVMRLAKQKGVTVLLDGQGADEMLAGYHSYFNEISDDLLNSFNLSGYLKWRRDCLALHGDVPRGLGRILRQKMPKSLKQLVKNGLRESGSLPAVTPANPVYPREFRNVSSLRKMLWWHTTREGLVELLRYADRNSMAHSREVRLPFLDHNLVEFVFKLPDRFLVRDGWTKWIAREAFRDFVPPEISNRVDKLGYMPPQDRWLQGRVWQSVMVEQMSKLTNAAVVQPSLQVEDLVTGH